LPFGSKLEVGHKKSLLDHFFYYLPFVLCDPCSFLRPFEEPEGRGKRKSFPSLFLGKEKASFGRERKREDLVYIL